METREIYEILKELESMDVGTVSGHNFWSAVKQLPYKNPTVVITDGYAMIQIGYGGMTQHLPYSVGIKHECDNYYIHRVTPRNGISCFCIKDGKKAKALYSRMRKPFNQE